MTSGEVPRWSRLTVALDGARDAAPLLLQTAATIVVGAAALFSQWRWAWLLLGAVLALVGVVWGVRRQHRERRELEQARIDRRVMAEMSVPTNESVTALLRSLVIGLGVDSPETRISLWLRTEDGFSLAGRYSGNAHYALPGRAVHRAGQGLVEQTWREKECAKNDFPSRRDHWDKNVSKRFDMDLDVVKALRMHSRSYVGKRVDRRSGSVSEPIGVVIIEGTSPDGVLAAVLDVIDDSVAWPLLASECLRAKKLLPYRTASA